MGAILNALKSKLSMVDTCGSWRKYALEPGVRYIHVLDIFIKISFRKTYCETINSWN